MKKKIMALVLAATMAISAASVYTVMAEEATATETTEAAAEEAPAAEAASDVLTLDWASASEKIEAAGVEGDFVEFDDAGIKAWVPTGLKAMELDEQHSGKGYLAIYETEDELGKISFSYNETQYNTPDSYKEFLEGAGATEVGAAKVNGFDGLHYRFEDSDEGAVVIFVDDSHVFEVSVTPYSDSNFSAVGGMVFTSIQAK
ncbi:MAG: hypothetical protein J6D53_08065 [Blautia sp.]|nr:hypothetical protein [Blautia sp.]